MAVFVTFHVYLQFAYIFRINLVLFGVDVRITSPISSLTLISKTTRGEHLLNVNRSIPPSYSFQFAVKSRNS